MGKFIKRFWGVLIFVIIEGLFYLVIKPEKLEILFLAWIFLSLTLLIFNIFNFDSSSMRCCDRSNAYVDNFPLEKQYAATKKKAYSIGGIFDPVNMIYLLCIIVNIIAYIMVINK